MRKKIPLTMAFVIALLVMSIPVYADADKTKCKPARGSVVTKLHTERKELRMYREAMSAYPVKLSVKGNCLKVKSEHKQILPIYKRGGDLYLAMHLRPGVNWLNGLPRGQYRINNQNIQIR